MVIRVVNWLLAPLQVVWTHKLGLPKPLLEWVDLPFHWLVPASGVLHPGVLRVISSELRVVLVQSTYCTKTPRFGCPHAWRKMVRVYTQSWKVLSPHIFTIPYLLILNLTGIQYTVHSTTSRICSSVLAVRCGQTGLHLFGNGPEQPLTGLTQCTQSRCGPKGGIIGPISHCFT